MPLEPMHVLLLMGLLPSLAAAHPPASLRSEDGAAMVLVPAGDFVMGSMSGPPEERPPHRRTLPVFHIDRTEVSVAQYGRFLAATGHPAPPGWIHPSPSAPSASLPVTNIRWTDAMHYAIWAGKRLPTEAEWEKAARGADGRRFPWGDTDAAAFRNRGGGKHCPVDNYSEGASPCGGLNFSGNAWEWTADWFEPYPASPARTPMPGSCTTTRAPP
ncbi:MAG: SUMF1/EgtB/PvdO family nonheme iron enzyme [Verrucomicrobia bacterium]|nr:SUMF1/EgtB/PvdO family nonheme iron enzyme [Verrucomicrobiota bacterium]